MNNYHIAVVDVGKTNKKILLYDPSLNIVAQKVQKFEEYEENGIRHDDVEGLTDWILSTLKELAGSFRIRVISVSTHGATFVAVGKDGRIAVPEISYTTDPGEDFHTRFYDVCGDPVLLQRSTGTPNFNMLINLAKGIFYVQEKYAAQFRHVEHILHYPQYFGYFLTGNVCADPTYTGNHSYLWDFGSNQWSEVADALKIRHLLPEQMLRPWEVLGTLKPEIAAQTGLSTDVIVTAGIHDSNASMLPYIISMEQDFLLNSTGTWCVIMHEKDKVRFAEDELGKVVFYNMNAFSKPIKTAIFMGGTEYDHYMALLRKMHGDFTVPAFDPQLYGSIIREKRLFILPSVVRGIGQFPQSAPRIIEDGAVYPLEAVESRSRVPAFFEDVDTAHAVLNLSLAVQTKVSFDRADMYDGLPVFTEGGFRKNDAYNAIVSSFYPKSEFSLTNLDEATAYGAAMLGKAAVEDIDITTLRDHLTIDKIPVHPPALHGLTQYYETFVQYL